MAFPSFADDAAAIEDVRIKLPTLKWADVSKKNNPISPFCSYFMLAHSLLVGCLQVVLTSATTGQRIEKLFASVDHSASQFLRRISTSALNEVVNDATLRMAPPTIGTRSGRIYYCMQVATAPPTIVFFVNDPSLFTDNYQRYLERKIRESLQFEGTPIKMIWRGKSLRDVSRAAKRGAVGAITSGVLGTTLGTTGGEKRTPRSKKPSFTGGEGADRG